MKSGPLRVFIVDDEAPARNRLHTLLQDIAAEIPNSLVGEADNGLDALSALQAERVDVVLTDIRMPRMDGLELAQHLARLPVPPAVIFVTAYDRHAVQAFELNALDYLLKPIRAARLQAALGKVRVSELADGTGFLDRVRTLQSEPRRFLPCHERGRMLLVATEGVIYFRADSKYVTARTAEREFLLEESLTHLENEFADRFIRLHRGVLVAKDAVAGFERAHDSEGEHWLVLLRGLSDKLPVSRRQWPLVKDFAKRLAS